VSNDKEPELTPEQEALVGQFVSEMEGASGKVVTIVKTNVGNVHITEEESAEIRKAAVRKTVRMIEQDPPGRTGRFVRDASAICFIALVVTGTAYVVHAAFRAIFGG
jgi:hypothetical protein